jgi:glycerophosphoryl diester phosphodiesterase
MGITIEDIYNADKPLIFGHRGYSSQAPENTLPAFKMLLDKEIKGVELDVHLCKSGELVVTHDHTTGRIGDIDLNIEESTYEELLKVDAGKIKVDLGFKNVKIPTLQQVFELLGDKVFYDVELKPTGRNRKELAYATVKAIRDAGLEANSMISSFDPLAVRYTISQGIKNSAVIYSHKKEVPWFFRHGEGRLISGCSMLKPKFDIITKTTMNIDTKIMKYDVMTWTVDNCDEAQRLTDLGVKGICSNDPGLIKDYLNS